MRNSLKLIEKTEQYLLNELSVEDKVQFEASLENDAVFKQQFEHQKNLMKVAQRLASRKQIETVTQQGSIWSKLMTWLAGGSLIIGLFVFMFVSNSKEEAIEPVFVPVEQTEEQLAPFQTKDSVETPIEIEVDEVCLIPKETKKFLDEKPTDKITAYNFNGLKTWVAPTEQQFIINPKKGATIEGEQGVLVIVPTDAFLDNENNLVTGRVKLKMIEALTLEDMVLYNLGTASNGKALETGGMLHFDFSCNGQKVHVNPKRALYVEIPTDEVKNGMMAFKGEVENGKLNWVEPKPLKKYLVNVDFDLLDFLPTGFEDTVSTLLSYKGHTEPSDEFTDSLYYSLNVLLNEKPRTNKAKTKSIIKLDIDDYVDGEVAPDSIWQNDVTSLPVNCGLDPISVKTIKTKPYSKTFIATKEFEARIKQLHQVSNSNGTDNLYMYLENLSKDLSIVDGMVAETMMGNIASTFRNFAKEGLTNVKDSNIYQDQLNAYYNKKRKENKDALVQLQQELNKMDAKELNKLRNNYSKAVASRNKVYTPGCTILDKLPKRTVATSLSYSFSWASGGWVNIDRYLHLLSKGSEKVEMVIVNPQKSMEVYQWLNTIGNLTPLIVSNNKANALFPKKGNLGSNAMKNTFCFAISMEDGKYQWFEKKFNPYNLSEIKMTLVPKSIDEIRTVLRAYDSGNHVLKRMKVLNNMILARQNIDDKVKQIQADWLIKQKLRKVAFPCEQGQSGIQIIEAIDEF